jgi:hypothetical protein
MARKGVPRLARGAIATSLFCEPVVHGVDCRRAGDVSPPVTSRSRKLRDKHQQPWI